MSHEVAAKTLDATLAHSGHVTAQTGAGITIFGGFTLNTVAIVVGMLVGLLGLAVQWYYKHKLTSVEIKLMKEAAERSQAEHAAKMGMYQ